MYHFWRLNFAFCVWIKRRGRDKTIVDEQVVENRTKSYLIWNGYSMIFRFFFQLFGSFFLSSLWCECVCALIVEQCCGWVINEQTAIVFFERQSDYVSKAMPGMTRSWSADDHFRSKSLKVWVIQANSHFKDLWENAQALSHITNHRAMEPMMTRWFDTIILCLSIESKTKKRETNEKK